MPKETYGLKSSLSPEMNLFEDGLTKMILNFQFSRTKNPKFQSTLEKKDVISITGSNKLVIKADTMTYFCKMHKKHYEKLFNVNIQKNY